MSILKYFAKQVATFALLFQDRLESHCSSTSMHTKPPIPRRQITPMTSPADVNSDASPTSANKHFSGLSAWKDFYSRSHVNHQPITIGKNIKQPIATSQEFIQANHPPIKTFQDDMVNLQPITSRADARVNTQALSSPGNIRANYQPIIKRNTYSQQPIKPVVAPHSILKAYPHRTMSEKMPTEMTKFTHRPQETTVKRNGLQMTENLLITVAKPSRFNRSLETIQRLPSFRLSNDSFPTKYFPFKRNFPQRFPNKMHDHSSFPTEYSEYGDENASDATITCFPLRKTQYGNASEHKMADETSSDERISLYNLKRIPQFSNTFVYNTGVQSDVESDSTAFEEISKQLENLTRTVNDLQMRYVMEV